MSSQAKWDRIYSRSDADLVPACAALQQHEFLLPDSGIALDLACGKAGNAIYLAQRGLQTHALDISGVAVESVNRHAHKFDLDLQAHQVDLTQHSLPSAQYDVIVVANYLQRDLCTAIGEALAPGGVLIYQTWTCDRAEPETGPNNPDFLLRPNELLQLFSSLRVLNYTDFGSYGNQLRGFCNQAMLVAAVPTTLLSSTGEP